MKVSLFAFSDLKSLPTERASHFWGLFSLLPLILFLSLTACDQKLYQNYQSEWLISTQGQFKRSTTAGNLVATAIRDVHELDMVFYPTDLIDPEPVRILKPGLSNQQIESLLDFYPAGARDQFMTGVMRGSDIQKFLLKRSRYSYKVDLEVSGLFYQIHFRSGVPVLQTVIKDRGGELDEDAYYRIAISDFFFFSGLTIPSYKYGDGLNFAFTHDGGIISARESVKKYVSKSQVWPNLNDQRAQVRLTHRNSCDKGLVSISEVQGTSHISPLLGCKVTVKGVVTAEGTQEYFPGGYELYIQSLSPDQNPLTSEGLHIYLGDQPEQLEIGDLVEVSGIVFERVFTRGLGLTSLREVSHIKKRLSAQPLPEPEKLGFSSKLKTSGRFIPDRFHSSYVGDLNLKPQLSLRDGLDFWESLEGMRVQVEDLRVIGFSGGLSKALDKKSYLDIFVVANGDQKSEQRASGGGLLIDLPAGDFNPEILQISQNHFTQSLRNDRFLNVGDMIWGQTTGIIGYQRSFFGDQNYTFLIPQRQKSLDRYFDCDARKTPTPLSCQDETASQEETDIESQQRCARKKPHSEGLQSYEQLFTSNASAFENTICEQRPQTTLISRSTDELTAATFNVENLPGNEKERIEVIADSISTTLKCPDLLALVEIQDNNGTDREGGSGADQTLEKLIQGIDCPAENPGEKAYSYINIDPQTHSEGGEPGGNIRVAFIYKKSKLSFSPRGLSHPLDEVSVLPDGSLSLNPGRIYPQDKAFQGSRRSLVVEFGYKGEKLYVIGNHFNSKLGDSSRKAAVQPFQSRSELRRIPKAARINNFVQYLTRVNPQANILVMGDFNAHIEETSMRVLEGDQSQKDLINLVEALVPKNDRYSTSYQGNSQPLDYIFANPRMLSRCAETEVIHINSDYMGALSDHDPVVSRFCF